VPLQQEPAPAKAGGAPGIDGQDFADIEAYGVERWLAELALALRQETYRPEPIRRVFIPKANGKLRPLGISSVRDRVCMTAALLVLEPIPRVRPLAGPRTPSKPIFRRKSTPTALRATPSRQS
jgi:retron-type reverse transcriptase